MNRRSVIVAVLAVLTVGGVAVYAKKGCPPVPVPAKPPVEVPVPPVAAPAPTPEPNTPASPAPAAEPAK